MRTKKRAHFIFCAPLLTFLYCILTAGPVPAAPSLPRLEDLEPRVCNGLEVLSALSALARDESLQELQQRRLGPKYFANLTVSYHDDPQDNFKDIYEEIYGALPKRWAEDPQIIGVRDRLYRKDVNRSYYTSVSGGAGFSFPLFGTWNRQKIERIQAEIKKMESKHRAESLQNKALLALRKAYVSLWAEQMKLTQTARFLAAEKQSQRILGERQRKGLLLSADKLEFTAAYAMARRDEALSKLRLIQALQIIRLATGCPWSPDAPVPPPTFPRVEKGRSESVQDPDVLHQQALNAQYEKLWKTTGGNDRESSLSVGATIGNTAHGSAEVEVFASLSISEPFRVFTSAEDHAKKAAAYELKRAEQETRLIQMKKDAEMEETLYLADFAVQNAGAQRSRLAAAAEAVRMRTLRYRAMAGDTYEQLEKARYQYYRTALEYIEAESLLMQATADIISAVCPGGAATEPAQRDAVIGGEEQSYLLEACWLAPAADRQTLKRQALLTTLSSRPSKAPRAAPEKAGAPKHPDFSALPLAVYVWDARPFLSPQTRRSELERLGAAGFKRAALSLTAAQIDRACSASGKKSLEGLLSQFHKRGIKVDLLLGDPLWTLDEHREELISLLRRLHGIPFDGLHLDIEPDSLKETSLTKPQLLSELCATLRSVRKTTDLPLSISIHPRYLEGELGTLAQKELTPLGLRSVTVMFYSSDPMAAGRRMQKILKDRAGLPLALAQSVESSISPQESYADKGRSEFQKAMKELTSQLKPFGIRELWIQSWEDYRRRP